MLVLVVIIIVSAGSTTHALNYSFSLTYNYNRSVGGGEEGPLPSQPYQYSFSSPSCSSSAVSSCTVGWVRRGSYVGDPVTYGRYVKYSNPPSLPSSLSISRYSPPPPSIFPPFLPSLSSLPSYLVVDVAVPGDLAAAGVLEEEQVSWSRREGKREHR